VTDVIIVVMPEHTDGDHLDMIFTHLDRELCVVYPRISSAGASASPALHKGEACLREPSTLFEALKNVDLPLEPILLRGGRRNMQDASNGRRAATSPR